MDDWVDPKQPYGRRKSLFRAQYNALGKRNLAAIERIVASKYQRGAAFNRQHPFVDVLFSDITESGEVLDLSEMEQKGKLQVSQCECDLQEAIMTKWRVLSEVAMKTVLCPSRLRHFCLVSRCY
jgi:hypothetical protein